ncbi:MAG: LLM class flavin-dependent oxidoreductase, partial [Pseudoclavibacter sp.]
PGPQRSPVLFQAGASSRGRDLAAKYAEAVFLAAEVPVVTAQIADIRRRAEAYGRDPDGIACLVAGTFRVAETEGAAHAQHAEHVALRTVEEAAASYAFFTGVNLLAYDLDRPLPPLTSETGRTNLERFMGENAPTVREILQEFLRNSVMGAPLTGTPTQVVDQAEAVIEATGANGFLVQPDQDGGFDSFVDLVMPELRRRGLVKENAGPGTTLRERVTGGGPHLAADHPGAAYRPNSLAAVG